MNHLFLSDPASVTAAFLRLVSTGDLWYHVKFTLTEALGGYAAGATTGLAAALAVALLPIGEVLLRPFIVLFYAIPKIALAPLIVVWFGLGVLPKVMLAAVFVLLVVFLNTLRGLNSVSPSLMSMARVMGASRVQLLMKVALPSALPLILVALRISVPAAMIGAIVGEYIGSNRGIGYLILAASSQYDTAQAFAGILAILIIVFAMDGGLNWLERTLLHWAPRVRSDDRS
jgi:NitT/TauT family transport system permease protein